MRCSHRFMKRFLHAAVAVAVVAASACWPAGSADAATGPRQMENLGRGVVAVRDGSNVFISWRLLALDPSGIGFNVYRSAAGGPDFRDTGFNKITLMAYWSIITMLPTVR